MDCETKELKAMPLQQRIPTGDATPVQANAKRHWND